MKRKETFSNRWKKMKRREHIWWLNYMQLRPPAKLRVVQYKKKKKNLKYPQWIPRRQEVKKENSTMHQNDKNTLIWIKDTKTLRASPMKGKHQQHPSADQKLPRKLPREFKSSTKSLVKQSIMEGFPVSPRHKSNPLVSCEENFPVEFMKPPRGQNQHKFPNEP